MLGGTGHFGARIVRRLAGVAGLDVIATSRLARPSRVDGGQHAVLDWRAESFARDLDALHPTVVIHCAGPFQSQDYRVAQAALGCGAHYIDLADGREFVTRFARALDAPARRAGLLAVSGASTVPALSSAVVDALAPTRLQRLDSISIVIAPGHRAPRGIATLEAVLGYTGTEFRWLVDGKWQPVRGWQGLQRMRLAVGTRYAGACDVPDLELFPARYPTVRTMQFRAALEFSFENFMLRGVAGLRRAGLPLPIERWARGFERIAKFFDHFGSDRGAMLVELRGSGLEGLPARVRWELVAEGNHGPEVPTMAAVLLALKIARGEPIEPGARACVGMLSLREFESEFGRWNIRTTIRHVE